MPRRRQPSRAAAHRFRSADTERLTLRPLRPHDAEPLHRLINDWEVARTLASRAVPLSARARRRVDRRYERANWPTARAYHLAITGRDGDQRIAGRRASACELDAERRAQRHARLLGRAAASGAMASPPRPPAGWRAGRCQSRARPHRGRRRDRQSRLGRRAAPASAFARPARATQRFSRPRRRAAGAVLRGDARRPVRRAWPASAATPSARRAKAGCCWSPPAR